MGDAPSSAMRLPDDPLFVVDADKTSIRLSPIDLWAHRELLYFLTWRDVKVRYKQTLLGATWALLQPLLLMLIFSFVFGRLVGVKSEGVPYPLFAYVGLLPWTFFSNAVSNSSNSLITNPDLVNKVYVPRLLVPGATILAALVDFGIAFTLLIGLMAYYRIEPTAASLGF